MRLLATTLNDGANLAVILSFLGGIFLVFAGLWVDARIDKKLETKLKPVNDKLENLGEKVDQVLLDRPKRRSDFVDSSD